MKEINITLKATIHAVDGVEVMEENVLDFINHTSIEFKNHKNLAINAEIIEIITDEGEYVVEKIE